MIFLGVIQVVSDAIFLSAKSSSHSGWMTLEIGCFPFTWIVRHYKTEK